MREESKMAVSGQGNHSFGVDKHLAVEDDAFGEELALG